MTDVVHGTQHWQQQGGGNAAGHIQGQVQKTTVHKPPAFHGGAKEKDIKLGEFILSISNRETITEMGRLLTEVDPRLAQFYNDFDEDAFHNAPSCLVLIFCIHIGCIGPSRVLIYDRLFIIISWGC